MLAKKISIILVGTLVFGSPAAYSKEITLDFIDANFRDFMIRVGLKENEQAEFQNYYARLFAKIQETDDSKRRAANGYLYNLALTNLEKKHTDWYLSLKPFISDPRITLDTEINQVRTFIGGFLIRYGAYEEYCTKKLAINKSKNKGFWGTIKSCASGVRNTVVSWFNPSPATKTITTT